VRGKVAVNCAISGQPSFLAGERSGLLLPNLFKR
jgi:hypothetical protein